MATTGKTHSIKLAGKHYMVQSHVKDAQETFVPRYATSEIPSDRDFSIFNRWITKSCHLGEGQDNMDITDEDVSPYRYKSSSGIDISEKHKITTLYSTSLSKSSTNTTALPLGRVGQYLIFGDGENIYLHDGSSWGNASNAGLGGGTNITGIATDGSAIYVGASGVATIRKGTITDIDTISWASLISLTGWKLHWFNNYLFALKGAGIFYQIDSGGNNTYTYPASGNLNETFSCMDDYNGDMYFGGHDEYETSKMWKFDGEDTAEVTVNIPKGEKLISMKSAQGRLLLGTYKYTASGESEGHLYSWDGSQSIHHWKNEVETASRDYGIYTIGNYGTDVYFGWNHETGLGRYDLKEGGVSRDIFTSLSDNANNLVWDCETLLGKKYFTVKNKGVYVEGTSKLSSGTLTSSFNNLNTVHKKLWPSAEIQTETLGASDTVEFQYTTDKGDQYISAGTMSQIATKYKADVVPDSASTVWTKSGSASTEEISPTGILHISGASSLYYYRTESSISNSTGSCLEMKTKMDAGAAFYLRIYDGTKLAQVYISDSNIVLHDSSSAVQGRVYVDMTSNYQTIRVTIKGTTVKVYLNGALAIEGVDSGATATKQMRFDVVASGGTDVYIDHVYYSISDAYSPDDNDLTDTFYEIDLGNVIADSLGYKLILTNTSGDLTVLPVSVKSIPLLSNKKVWELTIKATDFPETLTKLFANRKGQDFIDDLYNAQAGRQIVEFEDIDGTTYNVIIIKGPKQTLVGKKKKGYLEALIDLTLWEV